MGVDVRAEGASPDGTTNEDGLDEDTRVDTSSLAALRRKISTKRAERYQDMPVPDLDVIVVRYGPVESSELAKILQRRNRKDPDRGALSSADILARACLGIYERGDDGELQVDGKYLTSDDGEPLTFATLGLVEVKNAIAQVRALYVTDGDLISTADAVLRLSGYDAEDDASGE